MNTNKPGIVNWVAMIIVMAAVMCQSALAQGGNNNPGVIPPNAKYRGLTYGEWSVRFWQELLSVPVINDNHPYFSGGAFAEADGVVFLAPYYWPLGNDPAIAVTVPAGTALFVPLVNAECSVIEDPPFHGDNEQELRDCVNAMIDQTHSYFAIIDGKQVKNLVAYRVESPLFEFGPLPENNLLGVDAGTTSLSVGDGFYILLAPLNVGRHVLRVGGTMDMFNLSMDTTFVITVVPNKK